MGYAPIVTEGVAPPITEQRKYQRMWEREEYRKHSPGEHVVLKFLEVATPAIDSTLLDFGAGTGRAATTLALLGNLKVTMLDFAPNCLDEEVRDQITVQVNAGKSEYLSFHQQDLTKPIPYKAKYGFCTDVMEHIPTDDVSKVLDHILLSAEHVFFQISCVDDSCGKLIGHTLHHTVMPYKWWLSQFAIRNCLIHWSQDDHDSCLFYVSAWQSAQRFVETGGLNVAEERCLENIKTNLRWNLKEATPHEQQDTQVILLAGGPSLNDYLPQIRQLRMEGAKLVTVNNTYKWAIDNGLTPSAQVMVDARAHNKRFVEPVIDNVFYFMASQVDPAVFDVLPHERTYLWHTGMASSVELLNRERPKGWFPVPTGSSVMLRAFSLLLMLGYHRFHVFGFDSCLRGDQHHAYAQIENDGQMIIPVTCGTKIFDCHPWMVSQAEEFQSLMKIIGSHVDVELYGDGLIAEIIKTGAEMFDQQTFNLPD